MRPVLFEFDWGLQHVVVRSYDAFLIAAWILGVVLSGTIAVRRGLPPKRCVACLLVAGVVSIVGGRLGHLLANSAYYQGHPERVVEISPRGFSLLGALLAGGIAGWLACRVARLHLGSMADSAAPALGLAAAISKLGCWLNGCCYGRESDVPWAVMFALGTPAHMHQVADNLARLFQPPRPVHPSQLYDAAAGLLAGVLAAWLLNRRATAGTPFAWAAALFAGLRLLNRLVAGAEPLTRWEVSIHSGMLAGLLFLAVRLSVQPNRSV